VVFISVSAAAIGAICGLAYLLVHWIIREAWFEIAVQDGSLCWTCAYRVGDPPLSERCPECGMPAGSCGKRAREPGAVRRFMKRHARLGASLGLAGIAAVGVGREITGGIAMSPFNRNVAGARIRGAVMQVDRSAPVPRFSGLMWEADGKWRPIPGDATKALVVYYLPGSGRSRPIMQLQLTGLAGTGAAIAPVAGNPLIVCDLSPDQAAYVLEHDVPQSLNDAMLQQAVKSGWVPMPGGGLLNCADVPPDGHFPEAPP
jgi:hypothetical protein